MKSIFGLVAFAVLSTVLWYETRRMLLRKRMRSGDRKCLSGVEMLEVFSHCALTPTQLETFLKQIERATDIPSGKLRSTDRFDTELAPEKGWEFDDGLNCLQLAMQSSFGGGAADYSLEKNPTVGHLLATVEKACGA